MSRDPITEFYTRHPYPPPVGNLDRARDEWRDPDRHRADHHLLWPDRPYRAAQRILVAGCGTWQAAKYALCRPDAQVVGIDVSATSIAHTETLKHKYQLANLQLRQCSLEQVGDLEQQYDLIVCTGVLHHLAEPEHGLSALRDVLSPDGALYMMVYATCGRIGVYMLQQYCRTLGIGTSEQEIRDLIATLEALPQQHPLAATLRGSHDARSPDALADALLNPRDRSYSVPELLDLLERHGLTFGRWNWQAPYLPHCGAIAATPHAGRLAALPPREQFAAMELWRGTMTAHSVIAYRRNPRADRSVRFDDGRWPHFIPIRLPWTQLILERLPAGAAGALINRSHRFPDLVLVLGAAEKRLVDAIDNRRSIADIAALASADRQAARVLFEKLWRYDQVVFDTSKAFPTEARSGEPPGDGEPPTGAPGEAAGR